MIRDELYIEPERVQRNPVNGRFLKGSTPHNKGKRWDEWMDGRKAKRVKRIAMKNLKPNMNIGGWNKKAVIAENEEGVTAWFESSIDAEIKTGICARNIRNVCNGKRKHAGGLKWIWA